LLYRKLNQLLDVVIKDHLTAAHSELLVVHYGTLIELNVFRVVVLKDELASVDLGSLLLEWLLRGVG
jgi:hypothetical protein